MEEEEEYEVKRKKSVSLFSYLFIKSGRAYDNVLLIEGENHS